MGRARRCSSFDEHHVGTNPQIRKILCPEEQCKLIREECYKHMPEESGMYKFDCEKGDFARQVPRTPTPIVVEVPKPRPLRNHEIKSIAEGIVNKQKPCPCPCVCECPCPPEPLYLPPIFGGCNGPCFNPCGDAPKSTTATSPSEKKNSESSGSGSSYTYTESAGTPGSNARMPDVKGDGT